MRPGWVPRDAAESSPSAKAPSERVIMAAMSTASTPTAARGTRGASDRAISDPASQKRKVLSASGFRSKQRGGDGSKHRGERRAAEREPYRGRHTRPAPSDGKHRDAGKCRLQGRTATTAAQSP